jgi:aminoglycoside phosphotransferase (APT) family kinase protein
MQKNNPETHLFERLVQKIDPQSQLLRAWALTGGVSAQVTALEIKTADGETKKMVVRRHGPADLAENPHVARDEFHLLTILQKRGIQAPKPFALDTSGEIFSAPYLVIEFIEGQPDFSQADIPRKATVLATALASIHTIDVTNEALSFLPPQPERVTRRLSVADPGDAAETLLQNTLKAAWPLQTQSPATLLHGDFWPGNVLWHESELAALIDWEDAAIGDPLSDLAIGRLEMLWAFGIEAMQLFTERYQLLRPGVNFTPLPYWDLWAALRPTGKFTAWAENETQAQQMTERHTWFIQQTFEALRS